MDPSQPRTRSMLDIGEDDDDTLPAYSASSPLTTPPTTTAIPAPAYQNIDIANATPDGKTAAITATPSQPRSLLSIPSSSSGPSISNNNLSRPTQSLRSQPHGPTTWPPGAHTLVLHGTTITLQPTGPSSLQIYTLSKPLDGRHLTVSLSLILNPNAATATTSSSTTPAHLQPELRTRHLYEITVCAIQGFKPYEIKRKHRGAFKDVDFSRSISGMGVHGRGWKTSVLRDLVDPDGTVAAGSEGGRISLFKAATEVSGGSGGGHSVEWKDDGGSVVAREAEGSAERPPSLEIVSNLEERELDLLVACWVAKVDLDAVVASREPFSLGKVRRRMKETPFAGAGSWFR